jgi:adenine-specific DNA-methyltransferase
MLATGGKNMEKLKMHSPNLTQDNIARIRDLFPGCVTEAKGEDGTVKLAVDFDQLRQELAESIVEGPQERYHLNWPGKREALLTANAPIAKTLRPCREESVDFDNTNNLFIEGDNLEALKLLQETYLGKIKLIYIDPPYNTGNDFIYEDDFAESSREYMQKSNQVDAEGNRLVANTSGNGRFHSDWLTMMYPRLKLARSLLSEDGAIFVSIDFNEVENLKKIMDEIFGEENFQRSIIWRIGWLSGYKTIAKNFIRNHDSILFYSKNSEQLEFIKKYIENNEFKPLVKKEPKINEKMSELGLTAQTQESLLRFINYENRPERYPIEDTWNSNEYDDLNSIAIVSFSGEKISKVLGIDQEFKGQKSVKMLIRILESITVKDDIILDFFGGTCSTAHAVMQLNSIDGGNRRFIMVQLPESCSHDSEAFKAGYNTISAVGKERIRRTGKKVFEGECHQDWNKDTGFRVLKVDTSNMTDVYYPPDALAKEKLELFVDNIKPDRTPEDLLFQVMLDWGVDLALPIASEIIQGKEVFFVDDNALAACFDANNGIDEIFVKELAKRHPLRVVFRDAGFKDSAVKINIEQIFKLLSPATEVKCI